MTREEAIRGSIKKWDDIVAGVGADDYAENCPLCSKYGLDEEECHHLCPVKAKTGLDDCEGSPWRKWNFHQMDCHYEEEGRVIHCERCKKLAIEERDFLISLLEKNK